MNDQCVPILVYQHVDWFQQNWDEYVAVSFLFRANPEARAEELGYAYLPQEVVTEEAYKAYVLKLKQVEVQPKVVYSGMTKGGVSWVFWIIPNRPHGQADATMKQGNTESCALRVLLKRVQADR